MAATKKNETEEQLIEIKPIEICETKIRIVGDSPLIVHAWSEKAKRQMLESQKKATKTKGKPIRKPVDDFVKSLYWIDHKPEYGEDATEDEISRLFDEAVKAGARWGFPVNSLKIAGNSAAYRASLVKNQMQLRGAYFLTSDTGDLAEIKGSIPVMREDTVRLAQAKSDLRYRGEFTDWFMDICIQYNANSGVTLEQLLNVINMGGFSVGIGEWRPERDGSFGRYHVETA